MGQAIKRVFLILPILSMSPGCATQQLAFTAKNQMRTQNDIYVSQVMENLAENLSDPTTLPHFTLLNSGVPSTTDRGTLTIGSLNFPARASYEVLANQRGGTLGPLGAERAVGANWTITPVNDPERLAGMRYLYLWINGRPIADIAEADAMMQRYLGEGFSLTKVPRGWLKCGTKHDKPEAARQCLVRHKTHYWVEPGMEDHLTMVTLSVLGLGTAIPAPNPQKPTQSVTWEISPDGKTQTVKVTRVLDIAGAEARSLIPENPVVLKAIPLKDKSGNDVVTYRKKDQLDAIPTEELDTTNVPFEGLATPPQPFIEHLNNYSNPLISPGLLSQPR